MTAGGRHIRIRMLPARHCSREQREEAQSMGFYLNSKKPFLMFQEEAASTYFVDKSDILKELVPIVSSGKDAAGESVAEKGHKYVCIARPRLSGRIKPVLVMWILFSIRYMQRTIVLYWN